MRRSGSVSTRSARWGESVGELRRLPRRPVGGQQDVALDGAAPRGVGQREARGGVEGVLERRFASRSCRACCGRPQRLDVADEGDGAARGERVARGARASRRGRPRTRPPRARSTRSASASLLAAVARRPPAALPRRRARAGRRPRRARPAGRRRSSCPSDGHLEHERRSGRRGPRRAARRPS